MYYAFIVELHINDNDIKILSPAKKYFMTNSLLPAKLKHA